MTTGINKPLEYWTFGYCAVCCGFNTRSTFTTNVYYIVNTVQWEVRTGVGYITKLKLFGELWLNCLIVAQNRFVCYFVNEFEIFLLTKFLPKIGCLKYSLERNFVWLHIIWEIGRTLNGFHHLNYLWLRFLNITKEYAEEEIVLLAIEAYRLLYK